MRFKIEKEVEPSKEWELWFAWYPVIVDEEYVWFEYVERKEKEFQFDFFESIEYYYRNAKNLIKL